MAFQALMSMGTPLLRSRNTTRWTKMSRIAVAQAIVVVLIMLASQVGGDLVGDANALMTFKNAVDIHNLLQWNVSGDVCKWKGIYCSGTTLRVTSIRLPGVGLFGPIPSGTLGQLTELRVLSLRSNRLSDGLPSDLANCSFMRSIYVENNKFSGPLPSDFSVWPNLVHLDFSSNNFSGSIPSSLANSTRLKSLFLQNNSLSGQIPALNISSLTNFSVAYNQLSGAIPSTSMYRSFPQADFVGNKLCGFPLLLACPGQAPGPAPAGSIAPVFANKHRKKLSGGAIAGIVIGCLAFLLLLAIVCVLVCRGRRRDQEATGSKTTFELRSMEMGTTAAVAAAATDPENRLVFFEGSKYGFELEDLLRASAEVLGKGSVGTAYKAVMEDGLMLAVKRLKDLTIDRKDFEQRIQNVGRLKHENLVPLIAYYFSNDEKLLVYEYMTNGSLSAFMHGNKGTNRTPLDWDTRMRIALDAAHGISYLHDHGSAHGNIKSSNILLTGNYKGCISDYGLAQLAIATPAANRIVGYRAPEVTDIRRVTHKSDVYSYGVLLLELLTGKAPSEASLNDEGIDLPRWVQSVVREEWTAEVFDQELMRYQDIEEDMVQVLQIAIACVAPSPDQRPTMNQVIRMLEDAMRHSGGEAP